MANKQWRAGYAAAKRQAAALARVYEDELFRMAVDDAMLDPARKGIEDLTPEECARFQNLALSMWQKGAAAHTAEDIAEAIKKMRPEQKPLRSSRGDRMSSTSRVNKR